MNKSKLIRILFSLLILNLIWEFSHYQLYFDLTNIPANLHLIIASFTDVLLISIIFTIISLKNKSLNWLNKPAKLDYFLIILIGICIAIFLELYNLNAGRWSYKEAMLTIFTIGLSPLVQLFTTAITALFIENFLVRRLTKQMQKSK